MGIGIIVCGLNGAGKSTIGKSLADTLHFQFIDSEDLYFPQTVSAYTVQRTKKEAEDILLHKIKSNENFVLASVNGDYDKAISSFFQYAVLIDTPRCVRIERVKKRSFEKFGSRMLLGGDLYEQEEYFLNFVRCRSENIVEDWIKELKYPVIRIDGTKPIEESIRYIIDQIATIKVGC